MDGRPTRGLAPLAFAVTSRMGREIEYGATPVRRSRIFTMRWSRRSSYSHVSWPWCADVGDPIDRVFDRFFVAGLRDVDRVRLHWPSTPAFSCHSNSKHSDLLHLGWR